MSQTTDNDSMLSISEFAEAVAAHPDTIRRWIAAGKIRGTQPGGARGIWRIPFAEANRIFNAIMPKDIAASDKETESHDDSNPEDSGVLSTPTRKPEADSGGSDAGIPRGDSGDQPRRKKPAWRRR